jgi:hypothetical protein
MRATIVRGGRQRTGVLLLALAVVLPLAGVVWLRILAPPRVTSSSSPGQPGWVPLPVKLAELGPPLLDLGVAAPAPLQRAAQARGESRHEVDRLLFGPSSDTVVVTSRNALAVQDLLWGWGLANRNPILLHGPMASEGDPGRFASVGGWVPGRGRAIDHYARHELAILGEEQQRLVERAAGAIYRPCCDNPADFPDCNHGMAMFALLQLLVSKGVREADLYQTAYLVNSLWYPEQYRVVRQHLDVRALPVDARTILGRSFSSASGFARIRQGLLGREP